MVKYRPMNQRRLEATKVIPFLFFTLLVGDCAGKSLPVYLTPDAGPQVWQSVAEIRSLMTAPELGKARRWPLFGPPRGALVIGPQPDHPSFDENPLTDEWILERRNQRLYLQGSDNSATAMAVFRFAEVAGGWLYFQPGPLGMERLDNPPTPPSSEGPDEVLLHSVADYYTRNLIGLGSNEGYPDWALWQGLRERLEYNHSLNTVVPPEFFTTHPEWFAKGSDGQPRRPPFSRAHGYNDHPDLTADGLDEWVIQQSTRALEQQTPFHSPTPLPQSLEALDSTSGRLPRVRQSPGLVSLSISLGDSFVFGEFPQAYPWAPRNEWFRRYPDWSPHVFAWSNRLARELASIWAAGSWQGPHKPDLLLGVLAYLVWEKPPPFPIEPNLVPYLTFDRSQWYDPEAREDDLGNVAEWARKEAPFLATWDYLFGYGFFIPRSLSQIVSESIPALYDRGVRAYFSQVAALWPYDAHTTWLTARLLWDTNASAPDLLDTFFNEYYGPAALPMKTFFQSAESRWMSQSGTGWWLRHWKDPWQIGLWDPALLQQCRSLLEEARDLAASTPIPSDSQDPQRFAQRVEQVDLVFAITEAFARYHFMLWKLQKICSRGELEPEMVNEGLQLAGEVFAARKALESARDAVRGRPRFRHAQDLQWVFLYDAVPAMLLHLDRNAALDLTQTRQLEALMLDYAAIQKTEPSLRPPFAFRQILHDTDFSDLDNAAVWHRQFLESENLSIAGAGPRPQFSDVRRGHIYQLFRARSEGLYLASLELTTNQTLTGECTVRIDFLDQDQRVIERSSSRRSRIAPVAQNGVRQQIHIHARAPEEAAFGRVIVRFYELDPATPVTLESIRVFRVEEPAFP
jgi:hypothetical protein